MSGKSKAPAGSAKPASKKIEPEPSSHGRRGRRPSLLVGKKDGSGGMGGPTWSIKASGFKPMRKVTDEELAQCKKVFFELDRDGSGSIDSDEISFMLRSLGLSPSDDDVNLMIEKFDHSKDGKIQLREFVQMYAAGLDTQHAGREEDFLDTYRAVSGNPADAKSTVAKGDVMNLLQDNYELEVDLDKLFDTPGGTNLTYEEFKKILIDVV